MSMAGTTISIDTKNNVIEFVPPSQGADTGTTQEPPALPKTPPSPPVLNLAAANEIVLASAAAVLSSDEEIVTTSVKDEDLPLTQLTQATIEDGVKKPVTSHTWKEIVEAVNKAGLKDVAKHIPPGIQKGIDNALIECKFSKIYLNIIIKIANNSPRRESNPGNQRLKQEC